MERVSVIMPTYNKAEYLDLTLASFCGQTYKNFEIIVIDDGSNDETPEIVSKYQDRLDLKYLHQINSGRAHARNVALTLASGEIILFNDDDRIVVPGFIQEHVSELNKQGERTIVIGWKHSIVTFLRKGLFFNQNELFEFMRKNPTLLDRSTFTNPPKPIFSSTDFEFFNKDKIAQFSIGNSMDNFPVLFKDYGRRLEGFYCKWIIGTTANMSLYKSFLLETELFDVNYVGWGMEDTDLSYRLFHKGGEFVMNRKAMNYHQFHPRGYWPEVKRQLNKNIEYFCNKYNKLDAYLFYRWSKEYISHKDLNMIINFALENNMIEEFTDLYRRYFKEVSNN